MFALAGILAACGGGSHRPPTTAASSNTSGSATQPAAGSQPGAGTTGAEGVVLEPGAFLAPASTTSPGTPVDGIRCAPVEQLAYHIHVHLLVYADGRPRALPPAIGIIGPVAEPTADGPLYGASRCYYWLHTHAGDGIIHVESGTQRVYTLGEFFDEWRQPLSANRVASVGGPITAFVNGKRWTKSPRSIPFVEHEVIQLDVGRPVVPFQPMSWAGLGL